MSTACRGCCAPTRPAFRIDRCGGTVAARGAGAQGRRAARPIAPGRPQQNGRLEALHLTLLQDTAQPPARSLRQQLARFRAFQRLYNEERPHQALGDTPPADHYAPSPRRWEAVSAPLNIRLATASGASATMARSNGVARRSTLMRRWRASRLASRKAMRASHCPLRPRRARQHRSSRRPPAKAGPSRPGFMDNPNGLPQLHRRNNRHKHHEQN